MHGACYLPQNRNLMIHVPKQHIVFGCTAEGKDHIMRRTQSPKAKMKREPPEEDFRIKRVPGYRVHGCHVGTVCSQNIDNSKTLTNKNSNHFESIDFCKNKTSLLETLQCTSNAGSLPWLPKGLVYHYCTSFACLGLKTLNWSQNELNVFAGGQSCIFK